MKRSLIALITMAAFASPALAAEPDGQLKWNNNSNSQGSSIGQASSAISQNGQFVSGNCDPFCAPGMNDQTTAPGSRADLVQAIHAAENKGRDKP
jgi:hypothetical protein